MINKVAMIGAGGHGRAVLNLARACGYTVTGIYDNSYQAAAPPEVIMDCQLLGKLTEIPEEQAVILASGNDAKRKALFLDPAIKVLAANLVHPSAIIEDYVRLGNSNLIMARAYLNAQSRIGDNNIINTGAIIEHESVVGNHCHISVGVLVTGRVTIGNHCFVGAGTVIRDGITIGNDITIGAGSVVVKDLTEPGVYVGNPARRLR